MNTADRERLLERFTAAWRAKDLDTLMALMTEECSFRASLGPEPGASFSGRAEVRRGFSLFLGGSAGDAPAETETEDPLISRDFAVTRWTTRYPQPAGSPVVVRACDILGFEGDRIKFKDTYRKVAGDLPMS
ncbi:MAG: nuclear transport factor 2 family protein [Solirubrobacteraceae bacterium]